MEIPGVLILGLIVGLLIGRSWGRSVGRQDVLGAIGMFEHRDKSTDEEWTKRLDAYIRQKFSIGPF